MRTFVGGERNHRGDAVEDGHGDLEICFEKERPFRL